VPRGREEGAHWWVVVGSGEICSGDRRRRARAAKAPRSPCAALSRMNRWLVGQIDDNSTTGATYRRVLRVAVEMEGVKKGFTTMGGVLLIGDGEAVCGGAMCRATGHLW
jgi:hypothetical protein